MTDVWTCKLSDKNTDVIIACLTCEHDGAWVSDKNADKIIAFLTGGHGGSWVSENTDIIIIV